MRPPRRDTLAQGTKCFRLAVRSWKVRGSWSTQQLSKRYGLVSVLATYPEYLPNRPTPVSLRFPPGRPCVRWLSIWRRIPSNWMMSSKIWLSARCLLLGPARLRKSPDVTSVANSGTLPMPCERSFPGHGQSTNGATPGLCASPHASSGVVLCWALRGRLF
jgi:hypothetical protein